MRLMLAVCKGCKEPIFDDEPHTEIDGFPPAAFHKDCVEPDKDGRIFARV